MSSALQPSPPALQRSKLGVSGTTSDDSTHNGQLETFLRERLENWDKEAAEVIMVWGRLGGMCSSEYQSQLRKARTTLSETNKKEKRRDTSALQARDDSKTDGHQSHRDRLAAEYWARTQAKLNAAQQQRGRQLRRQQRLQANGQAPVSLSSVSQRTPPVFSGQVHTLRAASTSVSPRLTAARGQYVPLTPAPPTSPPCSSRRASGGGVAQRGAPSVRKVKQKARNSEDIHKHKELTAPLNERRDFTLSGAGSEGSDGSSSLILSTTDEEQVSAVASTPTAATSQPSSSFSGTFIVRRRLSVHGQPSSSSTVAFQHTVQRSHSMTSSPRSVAPPPPQPAHQTCQRSSSTTSDATQEDRADGKVNAPSSVSTVDPSLPFHSRTVTAIFTYSSRSREKTSGPRRRRSTQERRLDNSAHTEQPRGEPDAEAQESASNAPSQTVSPIKKDSHADDLSSVSSAASYLNRGVLEEE
ncbi:hypothetical protein, unknown function [Leishmania donovani]|uniref:Uncharacterized protein n=1 Tax=Leishmania donovani TaxID=5661 RepID=A0A3Q8ILD3_LEIDO|nr:hypothetical protein, unknown function [Leishmania donovani]AYU84038.1 hypothetical protein LdCL_360075800 [Leishmania donovani]AYU84041.1 hypothetical protein LdCL_360076100 [Leishmania donovani]AYU84044.1 hypothetical protein LdCL_360076400 [Leishmania donovani]AYU84047.1 hypothetical protein LdCL_360076700 [Leishmania donovani]AYU84050.1 hypothetical protein LdCL_360077000 [Leishmania donovani]